MKRKAYIALAVVMALLGVAGLFSNAGVGPETASVRMASWPNTRSP